MENFVMKRSVNYWWERTLVQFGRKVILCLVKSPITPNMVTLFNLFVIVPLVCFVSIKKWYFLIAILFQVYMFLDIVDGNLARNKHMQSELGRRLDIISDTIFFTVVIFFVGISLELSIISVLVPICIHQIYGLIATYYIVPQMKKMSCFKHTKLKQWFAERGIIFGMDATLETLIVSILLLTPIRGWCLGICGVLWVADLCYRLYELKIFNKNN